MLTYSQEKSTISKIINSLNSSKFKGSFNYGDNKYVSDSISISKNLNKEVVLLNNDFFLFKLIDQQNFSVFLISNKNDFNEHDDSYNRKNDFEIFVFSKISFKGIILYFSNSMYLKKDNEKTEITFKTGTDFILNEKIIVNDDFKISKLANIQWFEKDLPINMKPHTNYIVQDFVNLKCTKRFFENLDYTEIELDLLFKKLLFEEKDNKIISIKNDNMFYKNSEK